MRSLLKLTGATYVRTFYNERIFREQAGGSSLENAKTALLQYNIMINRGIVPDALTFTSLIRTMGAARLEWQAYKLFSSMIDNGIEPLPETFVALKEATKPTRTKLIADINDKISGAVQDSVSQLTNHVREILSESEKSEQSVIDKVFHQKELPLEKPIDDNFEETMIFDDDGNDKVQGTVGIEHPIHSWNVFSNSSKRTASETAQGAEMVELKDKLMKLHEEELKIFLTIHKLLRVGTQEELVSRILNNVPATAILAMLHRRHRYFRAVERTTKSLIDHSRLESEDENAAVDEAPHDNAKEAHRSGDILYTPWGAIRKPPFSMEAPLRPITKTQISEEDFDEVVLRVSSGDVDQLPTSLLRRYASHYSLKWDRKFPESLPRAVEWHANNVLPSLLEQKKVPPTLAIKLRTLESKDSMRTIENYEAIRIISKRTKNLQVTDGVNEINTSIKRAQQAASLTDSKNVERARQAENLREGDALKLKATEYSDDEGQMDFGHVLAAKHAEILSRASNVMVGPSTPFIGKGPSDDETAKPYERVKGTRKFIESRELKATLKNFPSSELPPWELDSASQPFNIDTGRFGDPSLGRYMELNDGRVQLMPQHETLSTYRAHAALLPAADRNSLLRHKVHSSELQKRELKDIEKKSGFNRYRRFTTFIDKREEEKIKIIEEKPLNSLQKEPRRIGRFLKSGRDKERISHTKFNKFMRPQ